MEHARHFRAAPPTGLSAASGPTIDAARVESLASSLPASLIPVLTTLAYFTAEGQATRLQALGPGSRLVLQSVGVIRTDRLALTPLGHAVVEHLLEEAEPSTPAPPQEPRSDLGSHLRPVARVVSTDLNLAAAHTAKPTETPLATYAIVPADELPSEVAARPIVGVALMGNRLHVWQEAAPTDHHVACVLEESSMEQLPRRGEKPLIVTNTDGEPPATLLRRLLIVSRRDGGECDNS
ncbi:hypothetical protein [Nocardioides sp. MH1]|uniref:hypothetical protein n=1 Tax=Nocardioides sp. MH1 TaxID=3242490 RepID=UPI003521D86C